MPLVRINYAGSPDEATRARLIKRITEVVVEGLSVPPPSVNVLLTRTPPEDWGVAGTPLAEVFRARTPVGPRAPRSVWTKSAGLKLHALDFAGTAPAIIIVPGITSPAATWTFAVDALGVPNRVIVLDNRGRGRSDAPAEGYSRADYADDIAAWCTELALDRPIVLGHSMGARSAAEYAARNPGTPLIAIDPPMSGPDRPYPSPLAFYIDGLRAISAGATVDDLRAKSGGWADARIQDRIDWLPTCSVAAISESHAHFHDEAFLDAWEKSEGPALFVSGAKSPVVLSDDLPDVARLRPDAVVEVVDGAGHMIAWDNLDGFVAALRPWINRVTAERAAKS